MCQPRLTEKVPVKLGITYTYDYRVTYGNKSYESTFFRQLGNGS